MCFDFCSSLPENPCEESGGADVVRDASDSGSDCEVAHGVPVHVFDLASPPDPVVVSMSVSVPTSQLFLCASQTLSFFEKRSASGTLVCDQSKKATMNVEEPKTMPKRTPFKAVPECVRNRAPPAPEGTPPHRLR